MIKSASLTGETGEYVYAVAGEANGQSWGFGSDDSRAPVAAVNSPG